jgi:hypothetical protein
VPQDQCDGSLRTCSRLSWPEPLLFFQVAPQDVGGWIIFKIKMDLVEMRWGDVDWIGLAQDRDRWRALVNSVLHLRVPYNTGKLWSVQTTRDLSSSAQLRRVSEFAPQLYSRS